MEEEEEEEEEEGQRQGFPCQRHERGGPSPCGLRGRLCVPATLAVTAGAE